MVGFTTSALHQQGSAVMSPLSWSSHKVKRSVSASLAGEVFFFLMSEELAECEWISGFLESAVLSRLTSHHCSDRNRRRCPQKPR